MQLAPCYHKRLHFLMASSQSNLFWLRSLANLISLWHLAWWAFLFSWLSGWIVFLSVGWKTDFLFLENAVVQASSKQTWGFLEKLNLQHQSQRLNPPAEMLRKDSLSVFVLKEWVWIWLVCVGWIWSWILQSLHHHHHHQVRFSSHYIPSSMTKLHK